MKLNEQLKKERENCGYTYKKLSSLIKEINGKNISISSIKGWESGSREITPIFLSTLSDLYQVSIDDLIDPNVDPIVDKSTEYLKLGKQIHELCGVVDFTSLLQQYQIIDKRNWIPAPKYDLVMVMRSIFFTTPSTDFYALKETYIQCQTWMETMFEHSSNSSTIQPGLNVYKNSAGHLAPNDPRDPINNLNVQTTIYNLKNDLAEFLEEMENSLEKEGKISRWNYLEN